MKKNIKTKLFGLAACVLLSLFAVSCNKDKDEITEEQARAVLANAEVVMNNVSRIYESSATVEEMAQHLDEIKAMPNVENAWINKDALYVKIIDGGIIHYDFFKKDMIEKKVDIVEQVINHTDFVKNNLCEEKNVCIVIQWIYDEVFDESLGRTGEIASMFRDKGYKCDFILGERFTADYLCDTLPEYGVVVLLTHGDYNNMQHWITTGA